MFSVPPCFCWKQAIVNLQKTPKDARADIVIHAKIDAVMRCVMQELGVAIPVRGKQSASERQGHVAKGFYYERMLLSLANASF